MIWRSFTAAGLLLPAAALASNCGLVHWDVGIQHSHSHWAEFDSQGKSLLREDGRLPGGFMALSARCPRGPTLELSASHFRGQRDYHGQSTHGQALSTRSKLRGTEVQLQLWHKVTSLGEHELALGLVYAWTSLYRHLGDAGPVLGYPERHQRQRAGAGLRMTAPASGAWRYQVQASWAIGPQGRLHLDMPIADPLMLPSGRLRQHLELRGRLWHALPALPGWQVFAEVAWQKDEVTEGELATLWRAGNPVGGVRQPAHGFRDWTPSLGLSYSF